MSTICKAKDPANCRYHGTGTYSKKDVGIKDFFGSTPVPASTVFRPNYTEINELNSLRRKYHYSVTNGDFKTANEVKTQLASLATTVKDTRFIPKLVIEGKCGIDGCGYATTGGMAPDHYAGVNCKSGSYNHCTCDSCF